MENTHFAECHAITDEVKINLKMFSVLMLNRIRREVGCTDVVTIYNGGSTRRAQEFVEKLADPT